MATIVHKRGDTFGALCTLTDAAGEAQDLTGATIAARITWPDGTHEDLDVTILTQDTPPPTGTKGQFRLSKAYATSASWSLGSAQGDIQYTFPDATRKSTETFTVRVTEDITP